MTLLMNPTKIRLLKALKDGTINTKELRNIVGVKEWQFNTLVKDLINDEYIDRANSTISLRKNPKIILFRDVANKFDIEKLLRKSNEVVFLNLTKPITVDILQHTTKLSLRTVQRCISELESLGAIQRDGDDKIKVNQDYEPLYRFADLLKREKERENVEPHAEIIYQDYLKTLKRVPKGKLAEGELTGFSLFSDYGINYIRTHDYYIRQDASIDLQDILIHSILAAKKDKDKNGIAIAILFYLRNRDKMDLLSIRNVARSFGIADTWIDVEGYIRNNELKHPDLYLPRQEFEEKARLYDIPPDSYTLPAAYPDLFKDIGRNLETQAEAYLFGGENMRLKGLKPATKDCDIAVVDEVSYKSIVDAFKKMGYNSLNRSKLSLDDLRIEPSDMLIHESRSRMDIFNTVIAHKLVLSKRMRGRAKTENYDKLKLGIIKNEDVFLLKGVTSREGDIHDMAMIAQRDGFDWKVVFDELVEQEDDLKIDFSSTFLGNLEDLHVQTGIRPPFYNKLVSRVLTNKINQQIRKGRISLKHLVELLQDDYITEKMIRNKVHYLERRKFLGRINERGELFLRARRRNVLNVSSTVELNVQDRLEKHIQTMVKKIALPENAKKEAIEIAKKVTRSGALQGRRPHVIAAGIIDWILPRYGRYPTVYEISKAGQVSVKNLYPIRRALKAFLSGQ